MSELVVGILVIVFVPLTGVVTVILNNRQVRNLKEMDWKRENEVARLADQRARALLAEQKRTTAVTTENLGVSKVTHALVNSSFTEAKQSELDQTEVSLALLRASVARDTRDGIETAGEVRAAITASELKVEHLKALIADRLKQAEDSVAATAAIVAATAAAAEPVKVQVVNPPEDPVPVIDPKSL